MPPLDLNNPTNQLARRPLLLSAASSPIYVLNKDSTTAQLNDDDPYGIARQLQDDDGNVILTVVPDGAVYLDLFHHFRTGSDDLPSASLEKLQVKVYGWRPLNKVGARRQEPADYDEINQLNFSEDLNLLLPIQGATPSNVTKHGGMWFPLFDKNSVHLQTFPGTPEIYHPTPLSSSSSSSSSADLVNSFHFESNNNFVSLVGAKYIMVTVNQAADNDDDDIIGMVLGSFVW